MTTARAALLLMLTACASAPPARTPLHNVASDADTARGPSTRRCPLQPPERINSVSPALGAIAGTVIDDNCELLAGATIVVHAKAKSARAEISDEHGRFSVVGLTPGQYVVSVYYLDSTLERGGVQVRGGAVEHVQLLMPPQVDAKPRITQDLLTVP